MLVVPVAIAIADAWLIVAPLVTAPDVVGAAAAVRGRAAIRPHPVLVLIDVIDTNPSVPIRPSAGRVARVIAIPTAVVPIVYRHVTTIASGGLVPSARGHPDGRVARTAVVAIAGALAGGLYR